MDILSLNKKMTGGGANEHPTESAGKVNAAYMVAAINTLESVIKEDGEIKKEEVRRDE
jgi:uncharacterized protein with LGFP repeats